jgi:hypothetical protein
MNHAISSHAAPFAGAVRHREAGALLYRQLMSGLFHALFLTSVLLTLIQSLPPVAAIHFGSSQLREVDLLMLPFVGLWVSYGLLSGRWRYYRSHALIYALLIILVVPVFTGLAAGKSLPTVLRDVRTPVFFLSILPMLSVLATEQDLRRFLRFIAIVGGLTLLAGYVAWWRHAPIAEDEAYRFGIASALNLNIWLLLLSVARLGLGHQNATGRRRAWSYVIFSVVFIFFANDIRSVYVGVLGASALLTVMLVALAPAWVRTTIVLGAGSLVVAGVVGFGLVKLLDVDLNNLVLQDMRLRRLYSLIDTSVGGTVDISGGTNRDDRLLGFTYGFELGRRAGGMGVGYGDNPFVDLPQETIDNLVQRDHLEGHPGNVIENLLMVHNSYGWAFGRLGLWPGAAFFLVLLFMAARGWRAVRRTNVLFLKVVLTGSLAFMTYMLLLGFGGGAFFDYTGEGLITWLVCLAVVTRATALARRRPSSRPAGIHTRS